MDEVLFPVLLGCCLWGLHFSLWSQVCVPLALWGVHTLFGVFVFPQVYLEEVHVDDNSDCLVCMSLSICAAMASIIKFPKNVQAKCR